MLENEIFIDAVRGAVDSYIRMINEADSNDLNGAGKISPEWYYYINPTNEDFVILLEVMGAKREIVLNKSEWKTYSANFLGNKKLKELANCFS